MAKEVKAPGVKYTETRDIIDAGRVRAGEAAQQRFLESLKDDEDDKKDDATRYSLTEKQLDAYVDSYGGITDFDFSGGFEDSSPLPPSKPKPEPAPQPPAPAPRDDSNDNRPSGGSGRTESAGADWSASQRSVSTPSSSCDPRGYSMRAEGGLMQKEKPKPKKMKQGGMASKK